MVKPSEVTVGEATGSLTRTDDIPHEVIERQRAKVTPFDVKELASVHRGAIVGQETISFSLWSLSHLPSVRTQKKIRVWAKRGSTPPHK